VFENGPAIGGWNARGAWGSGLRADSLAKMHDDGTHGDATAGDSVYTVQFNYQKNSTDIGMEFKFGVNAEDNESGFGLNHIENIDVSSPTVVSQFGSINPNRYNAWNFDRGQPGNLAVEELAGIPEVFALSNNYPNPFNPTTSIEFNIPLSSEISLTIYNVMGQEVAKVHNGFAQPGAYKAVWNGRDNFGEKAPSGIYFYEFVPPIPDCFISARLCEAVMDFRHLLTHDIIDSQGYFRGKRNVKFNTRCWIERVWIVI
jgi:hypothetical protein